MKSVVMDTNFIMEVIKNKIDLQTELKKALDFPYELLIMKGTREELDKIISEQKRKERETAKLGLILIKNIKTTDAEGNSVDEKLANISDTNTVIATHDRELKKKIKKGIIIIRQKRYLQLI